MISFPESARLPASRESHLWCILQSTQTLIALVVDVSTEYDMKVEGMPVNRLAPASKHFELYQ